MSPEDTLPNSMQALVYRGPKTLRVEPVPVPAIRDGEILVKVRACGVCPTDIKKIEEGTVTPPRIFGHETAGDVVRVGAGVKSWQIGDRVALHHHVPCRSCPACERKAFVHCLQYKKTGITAGFEPAGGGYAEYVRVMPFALPGVVRIPRRNDYVEGAMLEPVNTVLKGIRRLRISKGDRVLVIGQGPIGLLFTRLLVLDEVDVAASDLLPGRLKQARVLGARKVWQGNHPHFLDQMLREGQKRPIDAAVLTIPSSTALQQALEVVRGDGKVLLFGHTARNATTPVDLSRVCVDEKSLLGSYSADITLQPKAARLVFSRRLDVRPLISHRFPIGQGPEAVAQAASPSEKALKVMMVPD